MRSKFVWVLGLGCWLAVAVTAAEPAAGPAGSVGSQPCAALTNATILIIRHAEKPADGPELSPPGTSRAAAYIAYFQHLQLDGRAVTPDHLFCTADSTGSQRPRLTLEPLSRALHLTIDSRFKTRTWRCLARNSAPGPTGKTC